jgi:hypothetical protein
VGIHRWLDGDSPKANHSAAARALSVLAFRVRDEPHGLAAIIADVPVENGIAFGAPWLGHSQNFKIPIHSLKSFVTSGVGDAFFEPLMARLIREKAEQSWNPQDAPIQQSRHHFGSQRPKAP